MVSFGICGDAGPAFLFQVKIEVKTATNLVNLSGEPFSVS